MGHVLKIIRTEKKMITGRDGVHYRQKEIQDQKLEKVISRITGGDNMKKLLWFLIETEKEVYKKNVSYAFVKVLEEDFELENFNRVINGEESIPVEGIISFVQDFAKRLYDDYEDNDEIKYILAKIKGVDGDPFKTQSVVSELEKYSQKNNKR